MHFDFNLSLWKLNTLKSRLPTPHHFWILDGWEWKHPAILKPLAIFWTILGRGDCCFISEKKIKNKTKRFNKPFDFAKKKPKSSLGMERFPTRRCEISLHDNVRDNIIWDRIYLWVDGPSWEMSLGLCICACVCVCVCVCVSVCVCLCVVKGWGCFSFCWFQNTQNTSIVSRLEEGFRDWWPSCKYLVSGWQLKRSLFSGDPLP